MKKTDLIVILISAVCLSACGKNPPVQPVSSNTLTSISDNNSVSGQSIDKNDLVFYAENMIWLDKGNSITINLAELDNIDHLDYICVRDCDTKDEVQLPPSDKIDYVAEEKGTYYVYAVTTDGEYIDLFKHIGNTQAINIIQEMNDGSGIIDL